MRSREQIFSIAGMIVWVMRIGKNTDASDGITQAQQAGQFLGGEQT
jgi:hypothetical protein